MHVRDESKGNKEEILLPRPGRVSLRFLMNTAATPGNRGNMLSGRYISQFSGSGKGRREKRLMMARSKLP